MKSSSTRLPDLTRRFFARTKAQTIAQRVVLLREITPNAKAISQFMDSIIRHAERTFEQEGWRS